MELVLVPASLAACCLLALAYNYWRQHRHFWAMGRAIPGPPGLPLIGSALLFMGKITEALPALLELFRRYGPIVRLWIGPRLVVMISDPEDVRTVLANPKLTNRDKYSSKAMATFFGDGLFSLRGDKWQLHRKLILPSFHYKILDCYVNVFGRKSKIMLETLDKFEGKTFDVYPVLSLCTLDSICETAIGSSLDSQTVGSNEFTNCIHTMLRYIHRRMSRPWLWPDFIYSLSPECRAGRPLIQTAHAFSEAVIARKLDEHRRGVRSPGITTSTDKRVSSFLDMLIDASEAQGSILSPDEIRDEVTTLVMAGLETTATVMSFLLVLVGIHTEVQAELHQELDAVFGSDDRAATPEDLQRLPALDRCIKETMRLFPVATYLPREIDEDLPLPSGYVLPATTKAVVLSFATHRDARYYPEPNVFRPGRWLPENSGTIHPYAFIPFSVGPRSCLGKKYADLQMKSVLSRVLRRYRVTTPLNMADLHRLELSMTLSLDQELGELYRIRLHKR